MKTSARNSAQQLSLFVPTNVDERFRIDEATRRRGLRHVAELKARLEARYPTPRPTKIGTERATVGARAAGKAA
ncbi:hypothetical protein [Desertimonas flava]|jgi:hypothetical protein|uniref:hypothetical protein n=1 Tax=Desertimonas flava TaxID=2064846 RepID=UPI000E34EE4F|nr:hypothetical protein [Desertimonas flava]